jgi:hypothetical protein
MHKAKGTKTKGNDTLKDSERRSRKAAVTFGNPTLRETTETRDRRKKGKHTMAAISGSLTGFAVISIQPIAFLQRVSIVRTDGLIMETS